MRRRHAWDGLYGAVDGIDLIPLNVAAWLEKLGQIRKYGTRIVVLHDDSDEPDVHEVEVSKELGRRILEQVPAVHIYVVWQPGFGDDLVQADVESMQLDRCGLLAGEVVKPDPGHGEPFFIFCLL